MVRGGVRGGCNNAEPINNKEWPQNHTCVRSAILFLPALLLASCCSWFTVLSQLALREEASNEIIN